MAYHYAGIHFFSASSSYSCYRSFPEGFTLHWSLHLSLSCRCYFCCGGGGTGGFWLTHDSPQHTTCGRSCFPKARTSERSENWTKGGVVPILVLFGGLTSGAATCCNYWKQASRLVLAIFGGATKDGGSHVLWVERRAPNKEKHRIS